MTVNLKTWHLFEVSDLAQELSVNLDQGLNNSQVEERRRQYGDNVIAEGSKRRLLWMLAGQFSDFMILVLIAAAVVSGVVGEPRDAIAILVIVALNAIIGFVQEYRAERALASLRMLSAPSAKVRRDGQIRELPSSELVPGDIVELEAGDGVPADLRLIESIQLTADESSLTGESQVIAKCIEPLTEPALPLGDRRNLAFKGSLITGGRGTGIVVTTGMGTELGRIAELLRTTRTLKTPLQKRLTRFGKRLGLAILAICFCIFIIGLLRGESPVIMFLTAVSLAVAAIPEALPAVVTVSLALGARKMIRSNTLVRRLPAIETLGSVTYICADKTGTLTENQMHAEFLVIGESRFDAPSYRPIKSPSLLGLALALNNDVRQDDQETLVGDPTEIALLELAEGLGFSKSALEKTYPRAREIPFDSETKRMVTVHESEEGMLAFVKGAPESVVPDCATWADSDAVFSAESTLQMAELLAGEGYRVLALASRKLANVDDDLGNELKLLALVALIDPPRESVPQAVSDCLGAGISPVMITGDHPGTAQAIAQRVGIAGKNDQVMTGTELASLSKEAFAARVTDTRVYARVNPEQKIRIVEALQSQGEFVAMTGDGVNDAPALKRADIGVAMGRKGTDVARQAADMVLMDDNFATIVGAVREGRRIFDNILKFIKYTMTSNSGEIWTMLLAPLLGLPIPLLPIHILWINLVTDGLPGLALAAEAGEKNLMSRKPRAPKESIFANGMWQHILWVGLLIGGLSIAGQAWAFKSGSENWQTVVFTVLTFAQLMNVLAVRSESESLFSLGLLSNLPLLGAILFTVVLQIVVIYVPAFQDIFNTQPLTAGELIACFALASVVLLAAELAKALVRRRTPGVTAQP